MRYTEIMEAPVVKAPEEKNFVKFKCPGNTGNDERFLKSVLRAVDKHSIAFTGAPLSSIFYNPQTQRFNLYNGGYYYGTDGKVYAFIGVDTENWRGFSVKIIRLTDEQVAKVDPKEVQTTSVYVPPKVDRSSEW